MHGSKIGQIQLDWISAPTIPSQVQDPVSFETWIGGRTVSCVGTNAGARAIAFQRWRHFKEAFAPELVARAIRESDIKVSNCLDPFGGSGTTALACQFLGVHPITIEVNPYLADLIEAKLDRHDAQRLKRTFARLTSEVHNTDVTKELRELEASAPTTLVQPGLHGRYVFFRDVVRRLLAYRKLIEGLRDQTSRRFFRVLLGAIAVPVSNVTVSGKGRRYRGGWHERRPKPADVDRQFSSIVALALSDIQQFGNRKHLEHSLFMGDARHLIQRVEEVQLAVFSPPYPNSADYTDVYNVELWAMGYLKDAKDNRALRLDTLSSHVQLKRAYLPAPVDSKVLIDIVAKLTEQRSSLWHPDIPEMVGAYFADMRGILVALHSRLSAGGKAYVVLGDSRYASLTIPSAHIVAELAKAVGYHIVSSESFRSMRVAPQQGGNHGLAESLLVLKRPA